MFESWGSGEWTFAVFVFLQFGGVVAVGATMRQNVKDVEKRLTVVEAHNIGENIATIKSELSHIRKWIDRQS